MHKTVNISIGNALFAIEEGAYATLDAYLASIRSHFGASADAEEIVSDIEDRMAEEFADKLGKRRKVILIADVEDVMRTMGTVEDFREFDEATVREEREPWTTQLKKIRLYRDADNQILGGVAAGIARYLSIDPIIMRLAFGLSLLLGGFGVVLYLLLWIILPEARTTAEKVEMTGGKVTLSALQQRVDAVLPPEKRRSAFSKLVLFPFTVIRTIVEVVLKIAGIVLPFLVRLAGFGAMVVASLLIAVATFFLFALLLNPDSPYIGIPLGDVMNTATYTALFTAAYGAALMPLVLLLLLATGMLLLRNVITVRIMAGLFALWLLAFVAGAVTLFTAGPTLEPALEREWEERNMLVTETMDIDDFSILLARHTDRVTVRQGPETTLTLQGTERQLGRTTATVEDGRLSFAHQRSDDPCIILCMNRSLDMIVTVPDLAAVEALDGARVWLEEIDAGELRLHARGGARIELTGNAQRIEVDLDHASRVTVQGISESLSVVAGGASRIDAAELTVDRATVDMRDASRASIRATEELTGTARDASRVEYSTEPARLAVETWGAAHIARSER